MMAPQALHMMNDGMLARLLFLLVVRIHYESSFFFFSSRRRHTRWNCDWSSDVSLPISPDDVMKSLCEEAEEGWKELTKKATSAAGEADKLLKANKPEEAVALLESHPISCLRVRPFFECMNKARAEQDR